MSISLESIEKVKVDQGYQAGKDEERAIAEVSGLVRNTNVHVSLVGPQFLVNYPR
jgi:hypothetical protein